MKHQQVVIDHMKKVADSFENEGKYKDIKGLLVAHGMGSGKTLTPLWVAKDYLDRKKVAHVHIVCPNVSVPEFKSSYNMAGPTPAHARKIKVVTHDGFAEMRSTGKVKKSLVIIDEAHLFTETKYRALAKFGVKYLLLLSGTPCPNEPHHIVPVMNLMCRRKQDHWTEKNWKNSDVRRQQKFMVGKVAVYNIGPTHNYMGYIGDTRRTIGAAYPDFQIKNVAVKLQPMQEERYMALLRSKKKEGRDGAKKHPFFTRERKIVNVYHNDIDPTMGVKATPKIIKVATDILASLKKGNTGMNKRLEGGRMLVYVHNYSVLEVLKSAIRKMCDMKNKEVVIADYNGGTTEGKRKKVKNALNAGDMDVLIVSQAGSVGLDLKCTAKVLLLDVYWNIPTMNQVIGRAIRTNSHNEKKTGCKHTSVDVYGVCLHLSSFQGIRCIKSVRRPCSCTRREEVGRGVDYEFRRHGESIHLSF